MSENGVGAGRGPCLVCGRAGGLACSRCRGAHYCGPEHQRQHWPQHRAHCTACFEVRTSPELGRHLVATRDIPKGTVIIKEKPLAVMPRYSSITADLKKASCANCCRSLRQIPAEWAQCGDCGLPLCSEECSQDPVLHTVKECALLKRAYARELLPVCARLLILSTLRCLSLTGRKASALRSLANKLNLDLPGNADTKRTIDEIVLLVRVAFGNMFNEQDVRFVQGVIITNVFMFCTEDDGIIPSIGGEGLYEKMSMLHHSCVSNAKYDIYMNDRTDFSCAIIAKEDIRAGCGITISYMHLLDHSIVRRENLLESKNFLCRCVRCEDPSELGLHMASICCRECKKRGRPMSILEVTSAHNLLATFRCKVCGLKMDFLEVQLQCSLLSQSQNGASMKTSEEHEAFLQRAVYPNGLLHSTSAVVVRAKMALVKMYGHLPNYSYQELPDALLARKLFLCRELQAVMDVVAPGYSDERFFNLTLTLEGLLELGRRRVRAPPGQAGVSAEVVLAKSQLLYEKIRPICIGPHKTRMLSSLQKQIEDLQKMLVQT